MITICTTCKGSGLAGRKVCSACHGFAAGAELAGQFLYWGKRLDPFEIALDRLRHLFHLLINLIVGIIVLGGTLIFVWYVGIIVRLESIFAVDFWTTPHPVLLFFWFALLASLYFIYRVIRAGERVVPVARRIYSSSGEIPDLLPAALDEAKKRSKHKQQDISESFSQETISRIKEAYLLAANLKHKDLRPIHGISILIKHKMIQVLFGRLGVRSDSLVESIDRLLSKQEVHEEGKSPEIASEVYEALFEAYAGAFISRRRFVSPLAVFAALVQKDVVFREVLYGKNITEEKFKNAVAWIRIGEQLHEQYTKFRGAARLRPKGAVNRAMTSQATPALDAASEDLTAKGARGYLPPLIGREKELAAIFRVFEGGGKSVLLVGEHGTGKDALISGIAERMIEEEVPTILQDKRMVVLSVPQLVSGVTPSVAQERLLIILNEVARSGNIIVVVPNIHEMIGVSIGEGIDLADAFANEVSKGYFLAIATTSPQEYTKLVEPSAVGRTLEKIRIDELEENVAIQVLEAKSGAIEYQQKVFFTYDALEKAVTLTARYMHDRHLPEKAIAVAGEAAQMVRAKRGERQLVGGEDVAAIVSEKTKVPVTQVTSEESEKLLKLEEQLHGRVIGQDEAVKAVSAALRRARAELRSPNRPIANFLFLGPTGVGKTELSKTVAEVYFGNEEAMVRLDMSEYQDQASIYRMIGAPGETHGGVLSEAIRKQPFALLLLDELEKAHKDVLNIFLQVMDDGRLTDNGGRVIDFTNVILIATSNAGSSLIQEEMKKGTAIEAVKDKLIGEVLKSHFRPEFLNRFDGVIVFKPLNQDEILQIAWLMIGAISKRLETKGIKLKVEDAAADELAKAGFDPIFGARPLRRAIAERVENSLANFLLTQKVDRRDTVIFKAGGTIEIKKAEQL